MIATMIVAVNPAITGIIFFLTRSAGSTPHMAATGITAHGMIVLLHRRQPLLYLL